MMGLSVRTPVRKSCCVVQSKVLPSPQVTVDVVVGELVSTASTLPVMVSNPVAAAVRVRSREDPGRLLKRALVDAGLEARAARLRAAVDRGPAVHRSPIGASEHSGAERYPNRLGRLHQLARGTRVGHRAHPLHRERTSFIVDQLLHLGFGRAGTVPGFGARDANTSPNVGSPFPSRPEATGSSRRRFSP